MTEQTPMWPWPAAPAGLVDRQPTLDVVGALYALPRERGEPDDLYRARLAVRIASGRAVVNGEADCRAPAVTRTALLP